MLRIRAVGTIAGGFFFVPPAKLLLREHGDRSGFVYGCRKGIALKAECGQSVTRRIGGRGHRKWAKDRPASQFEGSAAQAENRGQKMIWQQIFLPCIFLPLFRRRAVTPHLAGVLNVGPFSKRNQWGLVLGTKRQMRLWTLCLQNRARSVLAIGWFEPIPMRTIHRERVAPRRLYLKNVSFIAAAVYLDELW